MVYIYYYNKENLETYSRITVKILANQFFHLRNMHRIEKDTLGLGICNTLIILFFLFCKSITHYELAKK